MKNKGSSSASDHCVSTTPLLCALCLHHAGLLPSVVPRHLLSDVTCYKVLPLGFDYRSVTFVLHFCRKYFLPLAQVHMYMGKWHTNLWQKWRTKVWAPLGIVSPPRCFAHFCSASSFALTSRVTRYCPWVSNIGYWTSVFHFCCKYVCHSPMYVCIWASGIRTYNRKAKGTMKAFAIGLGLIYHPI